MVGHYDHERACRVSLATRKGYHIGIGRFGQRQRPVPIWRCSRTPFWMVLGSDLLDGRKKRPFADVKTHPSTSTSASKPGAVLFSAWRSSRQRQRRSGEIPTGPSPALPYVAAHEFIDQRTLDYAAEVVARMRQRQAHRALAAQYDEESHN